MLAETRKSKYYLFFIFTKKGNDIFEIWRK